MSRRADEVRKRIARRKERQVRRLNENIRVRDIPITYEDLPIMEKTNITKATDVFEEDMSNKRHPLFRKEVFILKVIVSTILVVIVAILFKTNNTAFDHSRSVVQGVFEQEFPFATVSEWYEEQFGTPLALWTDSPKKETGVAHVDYAVPATGKIIETFEANGQGVLVQTAVHASVEAIDKGRVTFVGTKQGIGKTVIIQHADGSYSWYGKLDSVAVKLYDQVEAKRTIGTVSNNDDEKSGNYYFAIKQKDGFVDPNKVIPFD
jgi:stage IV sporulation protein FA